MALRLRRRLHLRRPRTFHDGRDAHAACGADGDEPAAAVLGEQLGEIGHDAGAGRREGVAVGDGRAFDVELGAVDCA